MRVLVLDDPEVAQAVCDGLTERGHEGFMASAEQWVSDPAAAELAVTCRAQAAIVGIRPYDMAGIGLAEEIRAAAGRRVRIIAFGVTDSDVRAVGKEKLFDAYLPKPATIETIEAALGLV